MASVEGIRHRSSGTPEIHNPSTERVFENRFCGRTARSSYLMILILIVPILIVTTLIVATYLPETSGQFELLKLTSGPYELLKLVLIWGPSFCRAESCNRNTRIPNFTLHGLWPDNRTGKLCYCSDTLYTPLKNQSAINERDEYWFNYFLNDTPNVRRCGEQRFWSREWTKHGTCSEINFRQAEYFNLAVALTRRYNLRIKEEILSRVAFPNRSTKVLKAIKNVTNGKLPQVRCARNRRGQLFLNEVVICFDPTGTNLVDCPGTDECRSCSTNSTCWRCSNELIEMPERF